MDKLTAQYISLAWPIAIQRFKTSQLIIDVPDNFWNEDFFVMLAKEYKADDIINEVQKGLPDGEPSETPFALERSSSVNELLIANFTPKEEQVEQISLFILSKQVKWQMLDNSKSAKFRQSFRIALETIIPLDEKGEQLIKKAKEAVASSDEKILPPNDAVWEIRKFSPLCEMAGLRKRVRDSLTVYRKGTNSCHLPSRDRIPAKFLPAPDICLLDEACSNDRFEAALTLALAQTDDRHILLFSGVPTLIAEIVKMLRYPAAVEKEYLRGKTRFSNFENCQKKLPNFMNLYSICYQLRCERAKILLLVNNMSQQYRNAFEEDLLKLDSALGISNELILKAASFRWLKNEHFNNVQDARIELFESWVKENPGEVGLALGHRAIYSAADLGSLSKKLENLCSLFEPFGAEEACLLSQARSVMSKARYEIS